MNKTTLNSQKEKHSMLSLRRATSVALPGLRLHLDFYPRSPCGERQLILPVKFTAWAFLSTLSLRRATVLLNSSTIAMIFLSTLSLRRATIAFSFQGVQFLLFLSTLSLRRATIPHRGRNPGPRFLSTLSLRRATRISKNLMTCLIFLSTLSLRRATGIPVIFLGDNAISIHALLAESDDVVSDTDKLYYVFLSTLSLRRATVLALCSCGGAFDFYPRSPCGERH